MMVFVCDDPQENCKAKGRQPQHEIVEVEEQPFKHAVGQRETLVLKPSANSKPKGIPVSIWLNIVKFHRPSDDQEDTNTPDTSNEDVSGEETNENAEPQGTEEEER